MMPITRRFRYAPLLLGVVLCSGPCWSRAQEPADLRANGSIAAQTRATANAGDSADLGRGPQNLGPSGALNNAQAAAAAAGVPLSSLPPRPRGNSLGDFNPLLTPLRSSRSIGAPLSAVSPINRTGNLGEAGLQGSPYRQGSALFPRSAGGFAPRSFGGFARTSPGASASRASSTATATRTPGAFALHTPSHFPEGRARGISSSSSAARSFGRNRLSIYRPFDTGTLHPNLSGMRRPVTQSPMSHLPNRSSSLYGSSGRARKFYTLHSAPSRTAHR